VKNPESQKEERQTSEAQGERWKEGSLAEKGEGNVSTNQILDKTQKKGKRSLTNNDHPEGEHKP